MCTAVVAVTFWSWSSSWSSWSSLLLLLLALSENTPLIEETLNLRRQQAQILGYATHAEVSLATKMAGSVQAVDDLTMRLLEKARPAAEQELETLTAFAKVRRPRSSAREECFSATVTRGTMSGQLHSQNLRFVLVLLSGGAGVELLQGTRIRRGAVGTVRHLFLERKTVRRTVRVQRRGAQVRSELRDPPPVCRTFVGLLCEGFPLSAGLSRCLRRVCCCCFALAWELRRPYFALPNVLEGLFGLCKRLFGVDIVAADGQAPVWHKVCAFVCRSGIFALDVFVKCTTLMACRRLVHCDLIKSGLIIVLVN